MRPHRRLTFQLTPLLDLLLIVIFAQYMEVQQVEESRAAVLEERRNTLESDYVQRQEDLQTAHQKAMEAVKSSQARSTERFQNILQQHQQVGATLTETFNLPGRVMEQVLKLRTAGQERDADQLERAADELRRLLDSRESELLRFMIRYDEMQKHVSVWELHLLENGQALFTDGTSVSKVSFESVDEFRTRCLETSKSFAEPRPLTLILMTYGDTQAGFRRHAADGLPGLTAALRSDAGGTRWFDYSLMGFRPDGPLMYSAE